MYTLSHLAKYQGILLHEQQHKITWQRVMKTLAQAPLPQSQKKAVAEKILTK